VLVFNRSTPILVNFSVLDCPFTTLNVTNLSIIALPFSFDRCITREPRGVLLWMNHSLLRAHQTQAQVRELAAFAP